MKKLITVLTALAVFALAMPAQNANMMSMARAELSKRGLEEAEVRTRLLENGIDVDNIQPADYPAYQSRVISILDQMQAEKGGKSGATVVIKTGSGSADAGEASPAAAATTAGEVPQTTAGEEEESNILHPVCIHILAVDRNHLLSDMINCITQELNLSIDSLNTKTDDCIVNCTISFGVHSYTELQTINAQISAIEGVEEVKDK